MRSSSVAAFVAVLLGSLAAGHDAAAKSDAETCEDAVTRTIVDLRGTAAAQEVEFTAARRVVTVKSTRETSIRGDGRYRGSSGRARPFSYHCVYDADAGTASGVVLKESGSPAPVGREKPWQPDLSRLSPEACETAAAASLTTRYPSAGRISFASDTRRLRPASAARTQLEGQGQLERAPGLNAIRFSYRCEIETRTGKVVAVETGE